MNGSKWPYFAVQVPKGSYRRKSGVIIQGHIALEPADRAKPVLVNRKAFRALLEPRLVHYSRTRVCSFRRTYFPHIAGVISG